MNPIRRHIVCICPITDDVDFYPWLRWHLPFLHCQVSMYLCEISKYLVGQYFETMYISSHSNFSPFWYPLMIFAWKIWDSYQFLISFFFLVVVVVVVLFLIQKIQRAPCSLIKCTVKHWSVLKWPMKTATSTGLNFPVCSKENDKLHSGLKTS